MLCDVTGNRSIDKENWELNTCNSIQASIGGIVDRRNWAKVDCPVSIDKENGELHTCNSIQPSIGGSYL